ncbi:MAG: hypothetical protein Kow006_19990 [Gammaproteobacteria bacterium]
MGPARLIVATLLLTTVSLLAVESSAQPLSLLPKTLTNGNSAVNGDRREPELTTQERITLLEARLEQTQGQVRQAELAVATDTPPPGTESHELAERVQLLRRLARTYQSHLDALNRLQQIQQSRRDLAEGKLAKPLPEKKPYSIDVIDGLWADVLAKQTEIDSATASLRRTEVLDENQRQELELAEQALRQAQENVEKFAEDGSEAGIRARWLRDLAELRLIVARASIAALETDRQILNDTVEYRKRELALLRQQAELAAESSPLSEPDRDAKLAELDKRRLALKKKIRKAAAAAQSALDAAQEARDRLQATRKEAPEERLGSAAFQAQLARLQADVERRRILSETASLDLETARLLEDGVALEQAIWRQRYAALHPVSADSIKAAQAQARDYLNRIALGREQVQSQLNATLALIDTQQKRIEGLQRGDPIRQYALDTLRSYRKRIESYQQLLNRSEELQGLLHRWQLELAFYRGKLTTGETLVGYLHDLWSGARAVWNYELFTAEDTIEVDGQTITGKRSITVSKVATVLILLTVGIWFAGRLARLARWVLSHRARIHTSAAILAYRLVYIVTVLVLLLFALTAFKIPFTAFAFLGGALAIGIGFGAQNLINNFISGLILLMERPINLGDIVEVEGVRGEVTNIGARNTEVRRFDGVDILIPNSTLLEKNVTNLTLSDEKVRVSVSVGVAYGSNTREVARMIHHAVEDHGQVLKQPGPVVLFENFGESSLVFTVYFWVLLKPGADYRIVASDIRYRIDKLFRESGIELAVPRGDFRINTDQPLKVEFAGSSPNVDNRTPVNE